MTFKKIMRQHAPPVSESVPFCMILAIVGGFLGAYTFVGRGGIITSLFGIKAIWSTIVLLIYAVVLIDIEEHKENDIHNH